MFYKQLFKLNNKKLNHYNFVVIFLNLYFHFFENCDNIYIKK